MSKVFRNQPHNWNFVDQGGGNFQATNQITGQILSGLPSAIAQTISQLQTSDKVVADCPQPYILSQTSVPVILLSSATNISATGLITGLTALPYQPAGVVQVYCFARAGLAAGLYYARFSSTTSCQLYSDAAGSIALSGITAGAYAGGTSEATLSSVSVPGGSLGPNGSFRWSGVGLWPSNANNKIMKVKFGGVTLPTVTRTTSTGDYWQFPFFNRGAQNLNTHPSSMMPATGVTAIPRTIDTAVSQNFEFTAQLANAADFVILDAQSLEILPGG